MTQEKIVVKIDADLKGIIPEFLINRKKDQEQIDSAIENSDYPLIHTLGHQMKGCGGGYGFDEISKLGAQLEKEADAHNNAQIKNLVQSLRHYLENIEIQFESR